MITPQAIMLQVFILVSIMCASFSTDETADPRLLGFQLQRYIFWISIHYGDFITTFAPGFKEISLLVLCTHEGRYKRSALFLYVIDLKSDCYKKSGSQPLVEKAGWEPDNF